MFKQLPVFAALALAACASASTQGTTAPGPRGAEIGPTGHATILTAPPAPFEPTATGQPVPPSAEQVAAQEQFRRVAEFQAAIHDEADALRMRLERAEKGNFIDHYFENDGDPHVVYRFLRDGEATLAKYTGNPAFRASTGRYTNAQLGLVLDRMIAAFDRERVIEGGGYGNKENRVVLDLLVPVEDFRALAKRKGVEIPESVILRSRFDGVTASKANAPLPQNIAPLVRIFPRDNRPVGIVNAINSSARVVLQDGCFRSPDNGNALVLFPLGANLFVDGDGYLAYGSQAQPGFARVGEEIIFPGSIGEVTAPELVGPIHAACGPGKVIKVNATKSAAAERAQSVLTTNRNALRELVESYGLTDAQALRALDSCKQKTAGACLTSPPRPVARQEDCPAGTMLSHGLCRTAQGHIRPLPQWLEPFAGD